MPRGHLMGGYMTGGQAGGERGARLAQGGGSGFVPSADIGHVPTLVLYWT